VRVTWQKFNWFVSETVSGVKWSLYKGKPTLHCKSH